MNHLKRIVFLAAALTLLLLTACGGGNDSNNNNKQAVNISIAPALTVRVGETKTLNVTMQRTDDFSVSVVPATGSGCDKSGDAVACTPTAAGAYTVTVTASADTSKTSRATVTVPDLEIFAGGEQTLYADETESEEITFNAPGDWTATAIDDGTGEAPAWLTLALGGNSLAINNASALSFEAAADTTISGPAGNNSITITLQPNISGADRTAIIIITITATNKQVTVTITQRYITEDEDEDEVLVSISPLSQTTMVGDSKTFTVTRQNTGFTLSVVPASGHGCVESADSVVCTPTAAGTYSVTVTADADPTKTAAATLTADTTPDLPLDMQIAAGVSHSLVIKSDGSLWAWGSNSFGQLGDGSTVHRDAPVRIGDDTDWARIAAGGYHTIALKRDGSLWGWGLNLMGQVGNDSSDMLGDRLAPVRVGEDNDWVRIAAGFDHTVAIKRDGSLWAWGLSYVDRQGYGWYAPVRVSEDNDWARIAAGAEYTIALKSDGSLWVWGTNNRGQLGDGSIVTRYAPVRIGVDADWAQIAAGAEHTIAIKRDGSLWAWGSNSFGRLGDGSSVDRRTPVRIGEDADWAQIAAGDYLSLALKRDGSLWTWGGVMIVDGSSVDISAPVRDGDDTDWAQIAAGALNRTLILKRDGSLWTGQLSLWTGRINPVRVGDDTDW
jgi:alpha-tubulin suppressor-like RCC1 family protein